MRLLPVGVDHGLREDAAGELDLAEALAESLGLPFERVSLQVQAGAGLQQRARDARYAALLARAAREGAGVAVGHTLDDQAETVLGRLLRGSSVAGLGGIEPRRADGVIRPLIDVRRSEVLGYLKAHGIPFAADPSNRDAAFTRSRIRHGLLPDLAKEDAAVVEHLAALAEDCRAASEVVAAAGEQALLRAGDRAGPLREEPRAVRRFALGRWAEKHLATSLGRAHLEALEGMLLRGGEVLLPGGKVARVDGEDRLRLETSTKRTRG